MEIRFVSSLTAEDENQVAPALLTAVGAILDQLPIAYTLRIQTSGAVVLQHTHSPESPSESSPHGHDDDYPGRQIHRFDAAFGGRAARTLFPHGE